MNWKDAVLLAMLLVLTMPPAIAADLSGKITVLKKNGATPLATFDHALVYLTGITTPPPIQPALHIQRDKQFFPRVLPIVKGQQVLFRNDDDVQHNVFSTDQPTPFHLKRYPSGQQRAVLFKQQGEQHIYCNIHKKMIGNISILENHYFSITRANGHFIIPNIPPGAYTLHVQHIYGGHHQQPLSLQNENRVLAITLVSTKVIRDLENHKNIHGEVYKPHGTFDDFDDYNNF